MVTWTYNDDPIMESSDMPDGVTGMVYLITTSDGRKYIGRKSLYSIRKRKFGKKECAIITDKRKKLYEIVKKESDWKKYTGSNKDLNIDIANGIGYTKKILHYAYSKKQLGYLETKLLYVFEVLEHGTEYYNSNIGGKYFRKDV